MKHPIDNEQFIQKYMYFGKMSKSRTFPIFYGIFLALLCWALGGMSYYKVTQAQAANESVSLWKPLALAYRFVGIEGIVAICGGLGLLSLYFGWRNYQIKNTQASLEDDDIYEDELDEFYDSDETHEVLVLSKYPMYFVDDGKPPYAVYPEDIEELEKLIGFKLPNDYAQFLMETNGGCIDPVLEIEEDWEIHEFLSVKGDEDDHQLLKDVYPEYSQYGLPIVEFLAFDYYLILSPTGQIFVYNSDDMEEPEYLAESFTDLLEKVYERKAFMES